ncbi:hypothetical protein JCM19233_3672 [Vibrio astriarenae]|nr:hypothetical protein JCM19233_3672 [Vibrio sp. C7]
MRSTSNIKMEPIFITLKINTLSKNKKGDKNIKFELGRNKIVKIK